MFIILFLKFSNSELIHSYSYLPENQDLRIKDQEHNRQLQFGNDNIKRAR